MRASMLKTLLFCSLCGGMLACASGSSSNVTETDEAEVVARITETDRIANDHPHNTFDYVIEVEEVGGCKAEEVVVQVEIYKCAASSFTACSKVLASHSLGNLRENSKESESFGTFTNGSEVGRISVHDVSWEFGDCPEPPRVECLLTLGLACL